MENIRIDIKKIGDWDTVSKIINNFENKIEKAINISGNQTGLYIKKLITKGIISQSPGGQDFKSLHPRTISKKGSSKALIDHGDLLQSINHRWVNKLKTLFIGVHKTHNKHNIALIHENGAIIADRSKNLAKYKKVIKWLAANGFITGEKGKKGSGIIRIPQRSFIKPIFEKHKDEMLKFFEERFLIQFGKIK